MCASLNKKVLIAAPVHPVLTEGLGALGYECILQEHITQAVAYDMIGECTGVITSTRLQLDRELLDAAPWLEWIGRMGSGMEVIDLEYANEKSVACFASPEGNCNAVGEHALGMLLSLIRRINTGHNEIKDGIWRREENRGTELEGKTIGIIGYGHTGRSFAKKLSGFDMQILAYDKYNTTATTEGVTMCDSLLPIMEEADIISFHVPYQADTLHYFNAEFIAAMRKPFIIINTSRGVVADTQALLEGIEQGKIIGACLDVFEEEPVTKMNKELFSQFIERLKHPNIVVTPHIAGYTFEALYKMSKVLLLKIEAAIKA